jgi:hypothetical protein
MVEEKSEDFLSQIVSGVNMVESDWEQQRQSVFQGA